MLYNYRSCLKLQRFLRLKVGHLIRHIEPRTIWGDQFLWGIYQLSTAVVTKYKETHSSHEKFCLTAFGADFKFPWRSYIWVMLGGCFCVLEIWARNLPDLSPCSYNFCLEKNVLNFSVHCCVWQTEGFFHCRLSSEEGVVNINCFWTSVAKWSSSLGSAHYKGFYSFWASHGL